MPSTNPSVRRQGLLLNGDDILDPSLFKGDNGDAAIQGISDTSSGKEAWRVRVGGTGRGHTTESPAFTDQELLLYDAGSDTLKSSGVSLTRWNQLVTDVALMGPLFTQRVDGTVVSTKGNGVTFTKVGEVTLTLPANCEWRWLRVEYGTVFTVEAGDNDAPQLQVRLGTDSGETGIWHKLLPMTATKTDLTGHDTEFAFWHSAFDTAPTGVHQTAGSLIVAVWVSAAGSKQFQAGGTVRATGWYKQVKLPAALVADPNEVPLPGNFTPVNFQLRMPDPAGAGASNLEAVDASFTFLSGTQTMINWGPALAYNYALKVLYTLQKRNGGARTTQIDQARDWLTNIYLPNTAKVSQVVGFQDPWVAGNMARYPVGLGTIQAAHNLTQATPPTGEYRRNFALQTLPYVAA